MKDYAALWSKLKDKVMDNADACAQGQYCVNPKTYSDATARMEAYQHVLDIMKNLEIYLEEEEDGN